MADDTLARRVVSSMRWQALAQAIGQLGTWLSTLVVIRLLDPEDYGLLAMAGVATGFFYLVAEMGVGAAGVQARNLDDDAMASLGGLAIATNVGGFVLCLPAAYGVAAYFGDPRLVEIVLAQSVVFLFVALYVLPQSQLVRDMDFKAKSRVDLAAALTQAVVSVGFAVAGAGVWSLVAAMLSLHTVRLLGFRMLRPQFVAPRFGRTGMAFLRFGALVTIERLLFFCLGQVDVVIGGRLLSPEALGVFAVAMSIAATPLDKLVPIASQVAFAAFARIQDDLERVRRSLRTALRFVGLLAFPTFWGLAAVADVFVPAVLGDEWQRIVLPLRIVSLILPLKALNAMYSPALMGVGRPAANVRILAVTLACIAPAVFVGARFGVVGLAVAWVCAYPLAFGNATRVTGAAVGVPARQLLAEPLMFAGIAGLMAAAVWLAPRPSGSDIFNLILLVVLGGVLYVGLALMTRRETVKELLARARS